MEIRAPKYTDVDECCSLVYENWGEASADRCRDQMVEYFKGGPYAPVFAIADSLALDNVIGNGFVVGFAAFAPTMLMPGVYDLIWVAVHPNYKSAGVGTKLTEWRLNEIRKLGGCAVQLSTQKPAYFARFGFVTTIDIGNGWVLMTKRLKNADMG